MKKLVYGKAGFDEAVRSLYDRPAFPPEAEASARDIIAGIRKRGDEAVAEFAEKFDRVKLLPSEFQLPLDEAKKIASKLSSADKLAIRRALKQIRQFAKLSKPTGLCRREYRRRLSPSE